jgi:hypothetical protein
MMSRKILAVASVLAILASVGCTNKENSHVSELHSGQPTAEPLLAPTISESPDEAATGNLLCPRCNTRRPELYLCKTAGCEYRQPAGCTACTFTATYAGVKCPNEHFNVKKVTR